MLLLVLRKLFYRTINKIKSFFIESKLDFQMEKMLGSKEFKSEIKRWNINYANSLNKECGLHTETFKYEERE